MSDWAHWPRSNDGQVMITMNNMSLFVSCGFSLKTVGQVGFSQHLTRGLPHSLKITQ